MPTTYAHYTFGMHVYDHMDAELKQVIQTHLSLYLVGLHGPDILFYYRPLQENQLAKLGHQVHRQTAVAFFDVACKELKKMSDPAGGIAYLMGFFCHYMLDRECHPLVRKATGSDKVEHNRLEKEFDRELMIREQLDPLSYKPTGHLVLHPGDAAIIAYFYPGVTDIEIEKAVADMKRVLEILITPSKCRHQLLKLTFHLIKPGKNFESLLMDMKPIGEYAAISNDLADHLLEMVEPTSALTKELYDHLREGDGAQTLSNKMLLQLDKNFG